MSKTAGALRLRLGIMMNKFSELTLLLLLAYAPYKAESAARIPPNWSSLEFTTEQGDAVRVEDMDGKIAVYTRINGHEYESSFLTPREAEIVLAETKFYVDPASQGKDNIRTLVIRMLSSKEDSENPYELRFEYSINPVLHKCEIEKFEENKSTSLSSIGCKSKKVKGMEGINPRP